MASHPLSATFARGIEAFINQALPVATEFAIVDAGDALRVGPKSAQATKFSTICMAGDGTGPHLAVEFALADDPSGRFFRVQSSVFGLYVPHDNGKNGVGLMPVIRAEFQRNQIPSAHVHFHASSQALGWTYGVAGGNYRRSDALHFPVGSERFRPTIEDFLLFLDRERLFRGWKSNSPWRATARARLDDYEQAQAVATVRHYPEAIAQELRALGWSVTRPKSH